MSLDLHQLERDAMRRITATINRRAGQHSRSLETQLATSLNALLGPASPFAVKGEHGVVVYLTSRSARAAWARAIGGTA